jgi:hypothetical protein
MATDRRRINGPAGGTSAPVYLKTLTREAEAQTERPTRTRAPNVLRKMCKWVCIVRNAFYTDSMKF